MLHVSSDGAALALVSEVLFQESARFFEMDAHTLGNLLLLTLAGSWVLDVRDLVWRVARVNLYLRLVLLLTLIIVNLQAIDLRHHLGLALGGEYGQLDVYVRLRLSRVVLLALLSPVVCC
jgi:hypothetical protein